ncbi:hypothetical protein AWB64_05270 [Caballeronia sordidicola]|uniref:Uncharacterized protein n=1 Tax=Caballeronia sordidicola TaxID=196367 RepID=A0A158I0Q2_CABSO|nr:hypothetical protein AWB64_05270 [Caballeronia sordidicola]
MPRVAAIDTWSTGSPVRREVKSLNKKKHSKARLDPIPLTHNRSALSEVPLKLRVVLFRMCRQLVKVVEQIRWILVHTKGAGTL